MDNHEFLIFHSAPPPRISSCVASEHLDTSITIRWTNPAACGGRSDCNFMIRVNDGPPQLYSPAGGFRPNRQETYIVGNLQPDTTYSITVSIHNGVSDQDADNARLRECSFVATTIQGSKFAQCAVFIIVYPFHATCSIGWIQVFLCLEGSLISTTQQYYWRILLKEIHWRALHPTLHVVLLVNWANSTTQTILQFLHGLKRHPLCRACIWHTTEVRLVWVDNVAVILRWEGIAVRFRTAEAPLKVSTLE